MAWLSTLLTAFLTALYGNSTKPIEGSATAKSAPSMARRMQEIYCKNVADLTGEEICLLNHRYEDLQTFNPQASEFDVENGEINAEDLLAQAGLLEEEEDAEMRDHGYV